MCEVREERPEDIEAVRALVLDPEAMKSVTGTTRYRPEFDLAMQEDP